MAGTRGLPSLIVGAAVATVKLVLGLFFFAEGVDSFPTTWFAVLVVTGLALAAMYSGSGERPRLKALSSYHLLIALALLVVVGYSTYLALMIRSGLNPAIDEKQPRELDEPVQLPRPQAVRQRGTCP